MTTAAGHYCPAVIPRGMRAIAAASLAAALVLAPAVGVSAQVDEAGLADVDVVRYGGPDRYATSLLVAEAVASDAGGGLDWVVMVSGRSWHEAVVAASVAGSLGAPVLMTPPHEVRDDAMDFLERVEASQVLLVSVDTDSRRSIDSAVDERLRSAGLSVERVGGGDQYQTGVAVAERLGAVGELGTVGKTAIIASGEVFADALVAGPLSAQSKLPVLLTARDGLHESVAGYLQSAGIERVALMGGTAALSDAVADAIGELDIAVDRMAGATRFETATLTAAYAAKHAGEGCFAGATAGLARARVPFDSFSAAPLLARKCGALVLTDPKKVPESTAEYLDGVRGAAGTDAAELLVFGGDAAVSQAAIDAYLTDPSDEDESEMDETTAVSCGGMSDDPPMRLLAGESTVKEADWSPDCRHIAFANRAGLWVMDRDGSNAREILLLRGGRSIADPAWSADGTKIAFEVSSREGSNGYASQRSHIYVVDSDGSNPVQITTGMYEDRHPTWSPDSRRIAFERNSWLDRTVSPPVGERRFIVVVDADGSDPRQIGSGDSWNTAPSWSPDGTKFALLSRNGLVSVMDVDGTDVISHWKIEGNTRTEFERIQGRWLSKLSWSPDSTKIAFAWQPWSEPAQGLSPASGTTDIAVLDLEAGTLTTITSMDGDEINPDWSPDGRRILFNTDADRGGTTRIYVVGAGELAPGASAS